MELGGALHDHGRHDEAGAVRRQVVAMLSAAMASDVSPELGFLIDGLLYRHFVKKIETERHVRDCFPSWLEPMAADRKRPRLNSSPYSPSPPPPPPSHHTPP